MTEIELKDLKRKILERAFDNKLILANGTLMLANQGLNDEQVAEIAAVLPWNPFISRAILSKNNIHLQGAVTFLNSVRDVLVNTRTTRFHVDLSDNPISDEDATVLGLLKENYDYEGITLVFKQETTEPNKKAEQKSLAENTVLHDSFNVDIAHVLKSSNMAVIIQKVIKTELWETINAKNFIVLLNRIAAYLELQKAKIVLFFDNYKRSLRPLFKQLALSCVKRIQALTNKPFTLVISAKLRVLLPNLKCKQFTKIIHLIVVLGLRDQDLIKEVSNTFLAKCNLFSVSALIRIQRDFVSLKLQEQEVLTILNNQLQWLLKYFRKEQRNIVELDMSRQNPHYSSLEDIRRDCQEKCSILTENGVKYLRSCSVDLETALADIEATSQGLLIQFKSKTPPPYLEAGNNYSLTHVNSTKIRKASTLTI